MAPKKNKAKAKAQSGPKLQISAENENRLRRLLLNSARLNPAAVTATATTATEDTLTKAQKAKKLKAVYDKLSCEGFTNRQIELALSALREAATFESALDWLCLNLPGKELPLKFSTGTYNYSEGGSVGVISNQPNNSTPAVDPSITTKEDAPESPVLIKRQWNDDTLDSCLPSQADWIRQYVELQEEDESETWEDDIFMGNCAPKKIYEPRPYDVIAKEYLAARLEATKAKEEGEKKRQEQAGHIIRKLKQELAAIGLSDDNLSLEHGHEISSNFKSERASTGHEPVGCFREKTPCDTEGLASDKTEVDGSDLESHSMVEHLVKSGSPVVLAEKNSAQGESGDVELGGFFLEDDSSSEILPLDILNVHKQEKIRRLSEKNLDKLEGIWKKVIFVLHLRYLAFGENKSVVSRTFMIRNSAALLHRFSLMLRKGDPQKIPKAVLHQLCQKSGWDAPKFDKIVSRGKSFSYTVSILRKASGRGKNRKAGGLVTLQLPDQNETVESAEDAQNKVAAYALYKLFPEIPVHLPVTEPYAYFILKWMEGESSSNLEDSEKDHRSGFVDSLLNDNSSSATAFVDVTDKCPEYFDGVYEDKCSTIAHHQQFTQRETNIKEMESADLRQMQHIKMRTPRYQFGCCVVIRLSFDCISIVVLQCLEEEGKCRLALEDNFIEKENSSILNWILYLLQEMLNLRATLPIAALKGDILQLMKEHDVLVVCGETGSGKTTQVPQFILDDMIESGHGGFCNIICTQPRRIAAISVAERVADERCEPSPGSHGSLIGYQYLGLLCGKLLLRWKESVMKLNADASFFFTFHMNEKTRLLFCTTGIVLRKLMGDQSLSGITHIIVDEVHERSLLGDFLLIVLKNLIEKQSSKGFRKLKIILMSATVDSSLFSRYFSNCPVVTAEGRTHPVTTYFLEDIYDKIEYRLTSDSAASLTHGTFPRQQILQRDIVKKSRGRKNVVLSAWGDESMLSEGQVNPYFIPSCYELYSEQTQQNMKRLNEDVIDYELLENLICFIDETCSEGAILVFLPGMSEINYLHDNLVASSQFGGPSSEWIIPLHSTVASSEQKRVFLRPPGNIRKVVIATNIAETSITIDDVIYVIDCGKHKENRYNPQKKLSSMVEDWISQANAMQRRGRAGRVKPGICFCLYTRHRFEKLMRPYQESLILDDQGVLNLLLVTKVTAAYSCRRSSRIASIYSSGFSGQPMLERDHRYVPMPEKSEPRQELEIECSLIVWIATKQALEPPKVEAMDSAISLLYEVGALEGDEELTPLGHHLAKLPVDVLIGKAQVDVARM
ncbi:hypothetical protein V8G54_016666 [Vigna mungo]|uniref:RNA helicase n=1 Tax=Vigna mungo TaxID=3915 RepID=A0AAQ3S1D6_VIGMU